MAFLDQPAFFLTGCVPEQKVAQPGVPQQFFCKSPRPQGCVLSSSP